MKHTAIKSNFIYPKIEEAHYRFGSNKIVGTVLRENGDWRDFLPPDEEQNVRGIESSACYIEGQQHAIATIQEEQFNLLDQNYSSRFNALLSDGTEYGGDPLKGAESIRKDGLIRDELMPFSEIIKSWEDFHSWKGANEKTCRDVGRKFLEQWDLKYDIVFERDEPVDVKYKKLAEALKYSPVPMSVYAWLEDKGQYVKTREMSDTHLVLCVYLDKDNRPYFLDTYSPFLKVGEPFYDSDFAMRWTVKKKEENKKSFWNVLIRLVKCFFRQRKIFGEFYRYANKYYNNKQYE